MQQYFPLLTSALPEVQTTSLIGSALASAGALLELSGAGCCLDCSHRRHPCRPLLPNPCHVNPIEVYAAITKPLCFGLSRSFCKCRGGAGLLCISKRRKKASNPTGPQPLAGSKQRSPLSVISLPCTQWEQG